MNRISLSFTLSVITLFTLAYFFDLTENYGVKPNVFWTWMVCSGVVVAIMAYARKLTLSMDSFIVIALGPFTLLTWVFRGLMDFIPFINNRLPQ